jgi:hypothetical protein
MNLLTQNAKMKKTSTENNARIFNFSIPAYKTRSGKITCPFADTCVKYCYAQKGNYVRFPKIQQLMEEKYKITKQDNFILLMNEEIQKKKATHIRIHDSGEFFKGSLEIPKNLKIIFSEGSKTDNLINTNKDRHARIFKDVTTLLNEGYIDASNNDLLAITDNKKVGLVYH